MAVGKRKLILVTKNNVGASEQLKWAMMIINLCEVYDLESLIDYLYATLWLASKFVTLDNQRLC